MAYDDAKSFQGRFYTGMRVGGRHEWDYPDGRWSERKLAPDRWRVSFQSAKRRRHHAPPGSGAPPGAMFHWLVVAHQRVRKVDEDTYETFLDGTKWKVGHRRPHWRRWSTEYPGREDARARTIACLRATLAELEADAARGAWPLEHALDPAVLRDADEAPLDRWMPAEAEPEWDEGEA